MYFDSIDFAIFFPVVFVLYWLLKNKKLYYQNALIVVSSYFFYGCWDWRFLILIFMSTVVDYVVARYLDTVQNEKSRKFLLIVSILFNLSLLGFFKYFNFFQDNFIAVFSLFGQEFTPLSLNVILPVGISFYTFQTLSYTIDVYRKDVIATRDFVSFSAYVSFFPQLVVGPIERSTHLLPQFYTKRIFDRSRAVDGLRQILWGLVKKTVIADNCAYFADVIFANGDGQSGSTIVLGVFFYTIQVYGDLSGYSDMAIGMAKLFGFDLRPNFRFPYFARDIAEFWRSWHMSLTSWFRDYLYIPLGGSRGGILKNLRNTFIIFIVSGFWHGANWTFIVWGALNAFYFIPLLIMNKNRRHIDIVASNKLLPTFKELRQMVTTFCLFTFSMLFFRAKDLHEVFIWINSVFSKSLILEPHYLDRDKSVIILLVVCLFFIIEWLGRENKYAIEKLGLKWPKAIRHLFYYLLTMLIIYYSGKNQEFIYFQF